MALTFDEATALVKDFCPWRPSSMMTTSSSASQTTEMACEMPKKYRKSRLVGRLMGTTSRNSSRSQGQSASQVGTSSSHSHVSLKKDHSSPTTEDCETAARGTPVGWMCLNADLEPEMRDYVDDISGLGDDPSKSLEQRDPQERENFRHSLKGEVPSQYSASQIGRSDKLQSTPWRFDSRQPPLSLPSWQVESPASHGESLHPKCAEQSLTDARRRPRSSRSSSQAATTSDCATSSSPILKRAFKKQGQIDTTAIVPSILSPPRNVWQLSQWTLVDAEDHH